MIGRTREFTSLNKLYYRELDSRKKEYIDFLKNEQDLQNVTIDNYENQMYKIRTFEETIDKNRNIEYYTVDEISRLLENMTFSSESSAMVYKNRILDYLKFCTEHYGIQKDIGLLNTISQKSYLQGLVNKRLKYLKYITESMLYEAVQDLVNPQDIVISLLIFEGIKGTNNQDLINIKKEQYNKETKILEYVKQDTLETIEIKCNEFLSDAIERSLLSDTYYFKNGKGMGCHDMTKIVDSPYLIAPTAQLNARINNYSGQKVYGQTIQSRVLKIFKHFLNVNSQHVTVQSLYHSGIINRMVKLTENKYSGNKLRKIDFARYIEQNEKLGIQTGYRLYDIYDILYNKFKLDIIDLS
ncbi:hypothetical protein [Clostridium rectalis]|uniref:hypothetical protein n=1 Tax=Clostridium rectalis TaxID=2040295 RepID=UPI000F63A60C|nr:hypothetical protein [Clostridium rectalis]